MSEWKLFRTVVEEHNNSTDKLMDLSEAQAFAIVQKKVEIIKGEKFIKDDVSLNDELKNLLNQRAGLGKGSAKETRLQHRVIDSVIAKTILQLYNMHAINVQGTAKGKMVKFNIIQTVTDYVAAVLVKNGIPGVTSTDITTYLTDKVKKANV